jgi:hypothetical protein
MSLDRPLRNWLVVLCAAGGLAGCDSSLPPPPAGSSLTAETLATNDTPDGLQFKGTLAGQPIHLLVNNCKVYKVDPAPRGNVTWTQVLEGEFYPLPTMCVSQSLKEDKGVVTVFLGRQAFGAGGCCTGRPTYRTRDGITWTQ